MRKLIARRALKEFEARYDYDVSYMNHMLNASPSAFFKFAGLTKLARQRESAPRDASYAAKLVGALAEDCGPCTQLVVDMAQEAGVRADQIEAVLKSNFSAMSEETLLAYRFANALVRCAHDQDKVREAVRAQWGDVGVIDLTLAVQISRVFPMVKAGLGFARSCQRVRIGDHLVDVAKAAA